MPCRGDGEGPIDHRIRVTFPAVWAFGTSVSPSSLKMVTTFAPEPRYALRLFAFADVENDHDSHRDLDHSPARQALVPTLSLVYGLGSFSSRLFNAATKSCFCTKCHGRDTLQYTWIRFLIPFRSLLLEDSLGTDGHRRLACNSMWTRANSGRKIGALGKHYTNRHELLP